MTGLPYDFNECVSATLFVNALFISYGYDITIHGYYSLSYSNIMYVST
jgi:hypothetical protein